MNDEWEMKRSEMIGESLKIRWSYSGKGTQYEQKFGMTETITAYYPKNRASRKTKIATVFAQEIYAACPLFPNWRGKTSGRTASGLLTGAVLRNEHLTVLILKDYNAPLQVHNFLLTIPQHIIVISLSPVLPSRRAPLLPENVTHTAHALWPNSDVRKLFSEVPSANSPAPRTFAACDRNIAGVFSSLPKHL